MPVPVLITDLSTVAASNFPQGTDSPSLLDDVQRAHGSFIAQLRNGIGSPVSLASAATVDIGATTVAAVEVSGTATITSFGTNYNGPRFLRFTGILTLTHDATRLNIPGAANVTTAAGDVAFVYPNLAGNGWNVYAYFKNIAPGTLAIANGGTGQTTASSAGSALGAIGVGQTWTDVTASRAVGTTYTNSTGRPISVLLQCQYSNVNPTYVTLNGLASLQLTTSLSGNDSAPISFIVPNGNTYVVASGSPSGWYELR